MPHDYFHKIAMDLRYGAVLDGVKVIEHSVTADGRELATFELCYWRPIHAEVMTHRDFSRNASSSRAIPVKKVLAQVWSHPARPMHWGANQPGMQADNELTGWRRWVAQAAWTAASKAVCACAWVMNSVGLHKQVANRILEPFQRISVVLTASDLRNFFELRCHEDAQPEIYALAMSMRNALKKSNPRILKPGEWHLPYVTDAERATQDVGTLKSVSAARCCRVSYLKHDGTRANLAEDLKLCERLVGAEPLHASPFEHQATPDFLNYGLYSRPAMHGNLRGWIQHRKEIEIRVRLGS